MQLEYFQLIDRITALDLAGRTINVEAEVPLASTIFQGHFPGRPLMPGVLLIETMAQASGWLLIPLMNFERMPFLAAVKDAKMRSFVPPGEKLEVTATVTHEGSGFAMTNAEIRVAGKKICSATLTFTHVPVPNEEFRKHMAIVAKRIGLPQPAGAHD
jgi:3-hydroxyacyl-[acyl-carrier-protein] dehydratase